MDLGLLAHGLPQAMLLSDSVDVQKRDASVPHAPNRPLNLSPAETQLALKNALRYIPVEHHSRLAPEFLLEFQTYGHIYMYRFLPSRHQYPDIFPMRGYPIETYPAKNRHAAGVMLMIMNNLDPAVAQYPHELVTYGGNGSVFNNWAQFWLTMEYLAQMDSQQTLVMNSGHPLGLFPSHPDAPRVIVTNGMVVPNYSRRQDYELQYALGNTQYGQMTAGSYCYIGPQGIVHGTTITLMNAARTYLKLNTVDEWKGKVFVTAGLGGMSGAQPKAGVIAGLIAIVAEVDPAALNKRFEQGWIQHKESDLEKVVSMIKEARKTKKAMSVGWLGNVVKLWERLGEEKELLVDLGSDQTSLHNPYNGGYYPVSLSFDEARKMMAENPEKFKEEVQASLRRHVSAVNKLSARGMKFWDYGNAFMLEASRAGADILQPGTNSGFRYASYFEDFMGDIFSLGFGPFRWVCTSGRHEDLMETDKIANSILKKLISQAGVDQRVKLQYRDNLTWIEEVEAHKLVVGTEARILYCNSEGRVAIAEAFNKAIAEKRIKGPVMLSRDHHDVSGTDSPFRETSNITDGSKFCADMAVQNFVGDAFRGATSVSLHNGGGTGWGEAMNGGFLLLLDGTEDAARRARSMLFWDVNNGIARRSWSGNACAQFQIKETMKQQPLLKVTIPNEADTELLAKVVSSQEKRKAGQPSSPKKKAKN